MRTLIFRLTFSAFLACSASSLTLLASSLTNLCLSLTLRSSPFSLAFLSSFVLRSTSFLVGPVDCADMSAAPGANKSLPTPLDTGSVPFASRDRPSPTAACAGAGGRVGVGLPLLLAVEGRVLRWKRLERALPEELRSIEAREPRRRGECWGGGRPVWLVEREEVEPSSLGGGRKMGVERGESEKVGSASGRGGGRASVGERRASSEGGRGECDVEESPVRV